MAYLAGYAYKEMYSTVDYRPTDRVNILCTTLSDRQTYRKTDLDLDLDLDLIYLLDRRWVINTAQYTAISRLI